MKLAFGTNAFRRISAVEAIAAVARAGYDGVEIMADAPHAFPRDTSGQDVAMMRSALARWEMGVSNVNAFMMCAVGDFWHPSWIERDEERRRRRVEHTAACIGIAARLEAKSVSTEPGGPLDGMKEADAARIFEEGLREIIPVAAEKDVRILIEPEPGLLIENSSQAEKFLRRIDSPHVGLNFDVGHFFCVGEDPAEAFRRLAQWVGHVHLEDIGADRRHYHLIPGKGAVDFGAFFKAARECGYDGWMTVELYTYEGEPERAAADALAFLRRFDE
jgi:sugar phosphate isomerase/epimerase